MQRIKFCFVILHYQSYEDTIACINSIEKQKLYNECKIVVIDNASPNNTGVKLSEKYNVNTNVDVLLNDKNVGFSRGNNIACKYAKNTYNPDYYIFTNNDIVFDDVEFLNKLEDAYNKTGFQIIGPDIYNPQQEIHQSPLSKEVPSNLSLSKTIIMNKILFKLRYMLGRFIVKYFRLLDKSTKDAWDYMHVQNDVCLMGACIIVRKEFIEKKGKMFYPETDFYYEEYILSTYCKSKSIHAIYYPNLKVIHNSGGATRKSFSKELQRDVFIIENTIKAAQVYKKYKKQVEK